MHEKASSKKPLKDNSTWGHKDQEEQNKGVDVLGCFLRLACECPRKWKKIVNEQETHGL